MKKNFYWLGWVGIILLVIMTIGCFVTGDKFNGLLNLVWCGNAILFVAGIKKAHKTNAMKDQLIETIKNKLHNVYPEFNSKIIDELGWADDTANCFCPTNMDKNAYKLGLTRAFSQSRDILIDILDKVNEEPDIEDYLSRPGTVFKIHETPTAMFMSLGIKHGQVVCCNGIDIKTGEVLKQMDGNATLPTIDEVEKYWEHFRKVLK